MQTFMENTTEQSIEPKSKVNQSIETSVSMQNQKNSSMDFLKPNIQVLQKQSNDTGLPDNIKSGVENLSGISLNDVKVHYNSSKPAQMKALAYTQGTDIHLAPGQEKHLGHEAWHVVQQKQGRVEPTAQLKGININNNQALEHEADVMSAKAVQLKAIDNSSSIQWKQPNNVAIQLKSEDAPMQFWGLGQHKKITEEAFELARKSKYRYYDDKHIEAIEHGAIFNDVHGRSTPSFALKYKSGSDEFINESHHGGMQFLHTMSSGDNAETNKQKQMAWAKFCIDTRMNQIVGDAHYQTRFQNQLMYKYITSLHADNKLYEMMMPIMINYKAYEKLLEERPILKDLPGRDRAVIIHHHLAHHDDDKSSIANQTVASFFQAGNRDLDAGLIASGSLAHMIEDSFANSHAQRTVNLHQGDSKATDKKKTNLINILKRDDAKETILNTQTPIMLHANYNHQHSFGPFGKHSKGDVFDKKLNDTQGATQAQLAVAYIFRQLDDMTGVNADELPGNTMENLTDFIEQTLSVDRNALALQDIQALKNTQPNGQAVSEEAINHALQDTDLAGLGINFQNNDVTTTLGGRQYERSDWINNETNKQAQKHLKQYDKLLKKEQTNTVYTLAEKVTQYEKQINELAQAIIFAKVNVTKANIKKHATEMLLNVISMQKQINDGQVDANDNLNDRLNTLKVHLVRMINY